jgi:hypothetical protein
MVLAHRRLLRKMAQELQALLVLSLLNIDGG